MFLNAAMAAARMATVGAVEYADVAGNTSDIALDIVVDREDDVGGDAEPQTT